MARKRGIETDQDRAQFAAREYEQAKARRDAADQQMTMWSRRRDYYLKKAAHEAKRTALPQTQRAKRDRLSRDIDLE